MKKIITLFSLLAAVAMGTTSCDNDSNNSYYTISGEGRLSVNYDNPLGLYRMVVMADSTQITTYLLGVYSSVNEDGDIFGQGAAVYFTVDNADDALTISPMNVDIADAPTYYAKDVNFSSSDTSTISDSFTALTSGTIVIQKWGSLYTIKILGTDSDSNDIVVTYSGYIYASIYTDE
ncbi:MAG: hypothetical protein SNG02_00280 [Rikenellaceae bacterium]